MHENAIIQLHFFAVIVLLAHIYKAKIRD